MMIHLLQMKIHGVHFTKAYIRIITKDICRQVDVLF